jgi:hypothetical protein
MTGLLKTVDFQKRIIDGRMLMTDNPNRDGPEKIHTYLILSML